MPIWDGRNLAASRGGGDGGAAAAAAWPTDGSYAFSACVALLLPASPKPAPAAWSLIR